MANNNYENKESYTRRRQNGKGKNSNRNRRSNSTSKSREDVTTPVEDVIKGSHTHKNLATWYYDNTEMAEQASRLSFQSLMGTSYPNNVSAKVPTTSIFYFNPSPGISHVTGRNSNPVSPSDNFHWTYDLHSGINLAAQKLFTQISVRSGRSAAYAPQDLTVLLLAMGELISTVEYMRRFFGLSFTYNDRNRVWPKNIIRMLGLDADDFFSNLADYRMRFNTIITQMKQIPIPENVGYFHKCEYLYQEGYLDSSSSTMSQVYLFNPTSTWALKENGQLGSYLETVPLSCDVEGKPIIQTFNGLLLTLQAMVDNLLTSSTLNVIYADILNIASANSVKLWNFDYVSEAYNIAPTYNLPMLEIIHNLIMVGDIPKGLPNDAWNPSQESSMFTPSNNVYPNPNTNTIVFNPDFATSLNDAAHSSKFDILVDVSDMNCDVDTRLDLMEYKAARGFAIEIPKESEIGFDSYANWILPDHYVTSESIFYSDFTEYVRYFGYCGHQSERSANFNDEMTNDFTVFDWHPLRADVFYQEHPERGRTARLLQYNSGDLNYFTFVDAKYLNRLLNLTFMGLFTVR